MASLSNNTTIKYDSSFQQRGNSSVTFTVPAGKFFKGNLSILLSLSSISYFASVGLVLKQTNSAGVVLFSSSNMAGAGNLINFIGGEQISHSSPDIELGAGTYYLTYSIAGAAGTIANVSVIGSLYVNTP